MTQRCVGLQYAVLFLFYHFLNFVIIIWLTDAKLFSCEQGYALMIKGSNEFSIYKIRLVNPDKVTVLHTKVFLQIIKFSIKGITTVSCYKTYAAAFGCEI